MGFGLRFKVEHPPAPLDLTNGKPGWHQPERWRPGILYSERRSAEPGGANGRVNNGGDGKLPWQRPRGIGKNRLGECCHGAKGQTVGTRTGIFNGAGLGKIPSSTPIKMIAAAPGLLAISQNRNYGEEGKENQPYKLRFSQVISQVVRRRRQMQSLEMKNCLFYDASTGSEGCIKILNYEYSTA